MPKNSNVTKDIKKLENVFLKISENYDKSDLSILQETEEVCLSSLTKARKIQKGKIKGADATNILRVRKNFQDLLYDCRYDYLIILNERYGCEIDINTYLKNHRDELQYEQIVSIVAQEGLINNVFQNIIKELIPAHPKDEYKDARKVRRHFVIHCGGTNTGKTYNALQALKKAQSGVYLAPLRLLALEIFQTLNKDGVPCTLSTGEEDIVVPGAEHISSTIEKLNISKQYDVAVIDEAQMISDLQRGNAWTRAVLAVQAKEVHVCCSKNANSLLIKLIKDCGDTYEIHEYERSVPLEVEKRHFEFPTMVEPGDALVVFSKKMVLKVAGILTARGVKVSMLYGNLPPETRRKQMELFIDHKTDVVVTTDVIGMGLNLPIRRVVFMETTKYDGQDHVRNWEMNVNDIYSTYIPRGGRRRLYDSEIKQIAGRAGRKNIFDVGYVTSVREKSVIKSGLERELDDLTIAYSTPSDEYILSFPIGTLMERLVAWLHSDDSISYIKKANIDEPLTLLEILETKPQFRPLTIEDKYKLIFIPFDSKNEKLLSRWTDYIHQYMRGEEIEFPKLEDGETLDNLETYYRELDLYYSFCKEMNQHCEYELTMEVKSETSLKIHEILRGKIKHVDKCKYCGKELPWDFAFNICDDCFNSGRHLKSRRYSRNRK